MIETHVAFSRTFWSPLDSVFGQPFRNAPWTGDLSGAAGFNSFDLVEDMQAPVTRIHSLGPLCDTLNMVTISFGSWVLARLRLLSAPQHLITWLTEYHAHALGNKERHFKIIFLSTLLQGPQIYESGYFFTKSLLLGVHSEWGKQRNEKSLHSS